MKIFKSEQTTANHRTDTRKATVDYNTTRSFYVGAMGPHPDPVIEKTFDLLRVGFNEYETPIDKIGPQYNIPCMGITKFFMKLQLKTELAS
ncbi:hypothetical protein [Bacillus cereus]|uniref:hypothetical protein n=1 Tax=Bacillus cereus TaxID=1396 RepID=UPI000BED7A2B|nr:hypothetical protein [Bacillus cereus]PEF15724.1 hypothetical protein CON87_27670 [Bacillus cereus]PET06471.1 hypothetical protein CN516_23995 [Bacillus cereus]PEV92550.1 hypothetical protein CN433_10880 [Bacillus cereus]PFP43793.1 hypothetical protein COJ98_27505 [Bacillus cereus]